MAGKIKGITIEIGGDTKPLEEAQKQVNQQLEPSIGRLSRQVLVFSPMLNVMIALKRMTLCMTRGSFIFAEVSTK